jgi:hypothetical protein
MMIQNILAASAEQLHNDRARQTLEQILASPEFTRLRQGPDIRELIARFLAGLGVSGLRLSGGLFQVLLKTAAILAGLFLFLYLLKLTAPFLRFLAPDVEEKKHQHGQDVRPEPAVLAAQAEKKASAGDYRSALRDLYLALLYELDQRRIISFKPAKTNGEYLVEIRRSAASLEASFRPMADLFDYKWYGLEPCGKEDYLQGREFYGALLKEAAYG